MGKIPIREGLFTEKIDGSLIGFKCKSCNHILPPLTTTCYYCYGEELERLGIKSAKGSSTVIPLFTSHTNTLKYLMP